MLVSVALVALSFVLTCLTAAIGDTALVVAIALFVGGLSTASIELGAQSIAMLSAMWISACYHSKNGALRARRGSHAVGDAFGSAELVEQLAALATSEPDTSPRDPSR